MKDLPSAAEEKLNEMLGNVGDMSLKRRAKKLILDLGLKNGDTIVDLGCGDGFYLYLLSRLPVKLKLTGFDCDKVALKNAKKNLSSKNIKLVEGDLSTMPFRTNIFKKAIMTEVLEHVEDDKKVLTEVYRVLKPNGTLLLTVPSLNYPFLWDPINWILQNLFGTHISGIGFFAGIWARHKRLYKQSDLQVFLKKAGFKINKIEQLTTRCLPFNHYLVNTVARLLCGSKLPVQVKDSLNKFKNVKKPLGLRLIYSLVNFYDQLNNKVPGKNGLNIYIQAEKEELPV